MRQKKREGNIAKRREEKGWRKSGGGKGKGGKGKPRAGFEGSFRGRAGGGGGGAEGGGGR